MFLIDLPGALLCGRQLLGEPGKAFQRDGVLPGEPGIDEARFCVHSKIHALFSPWLRLLGSRSPSPDSLESEAKEQAFRPKPT